MNRTDFLRTGVLLALVLTAMCGCYRNIMETIAVEMPALPDEAVAAYVGDNLLSIEGITGVKAEDSQLLVTFNSELMASLNVVFLVTDMGFEANGYPANPDGRRHWPDTVRSP